MKKEDIEKMVALTNEFQDACENVCKHLTVLCGDYKYCHVFEINDIADQIECSGYYTVMNESQDVYRTFPIELLTYTNEQLDDYVSDELKKISDIITLKKLAEKYGYQIVKQ